MTERILCPILDPHSFMVDSGATAFAPQPLKDLN